MQQSLSTQLAAEGRFTAAAGVGPAPRIVAGVPICLCRPAEFGDAKRATVGRDGSPHVTPLWFAWDGRHVWLNSIVASQRWADDERLGLRQAHSG